MAASVLTGHQASLEVASWASLDFGSPVAPLSVAVVRGEFAERTTRAPGGVPLPDLDGVTVEVEAGDGPTTRALILTVEPHQLVFLVPDLEDGAAHLAVRRGDAELADGQFRVRSVSPGLFSAARSGGGLAAAVAVRVSLPDGNRHTEDVAFFNDERGSFEPVLLNPAAENSDLYLELQGTGIRNASALKVQIGGMLVPAVVLDRADPETGIDRISVGPLPSALARRQLVDIVLTADGIPANAVHVAFSPSLGPGVTFSNQIVRLFQGRCQTCHRPGEVAPFSLMDYESSYPWALSIKESTQSRQMPPWKAVPGHGTFQGERRLSEAEIALIARWVDAGAPEGDPADLPEPLEFDPDWQQGEPDLVISAAEYAPKPGGTDDYRCFSVQIPEEVEGRKSITKVEVRPGNRRIVHHVILFADPQGEGIALEAADPSPDPGYECFGDSGVSLNGIVWGVESYILGLWAPGARAIVLPEGSGYYLRPGASVVVQVHYHPDGTPQTDATQVGLHFSEEPTPRNAIVVPVINSSFVIPAGEERFEVRASFSVPPLLGAILDATGAFPLSITSVAPHMHLLGREIRMDKVSADGTTTPMIYIDDWDFDWQSEYIYAEPVPFHRDDRLEVSALYDNSENNPRNPNSPPIPVGWGPRSSDEMCIVFFLVDIPDLCPLGICNH